MHRKHCDTRYQRTGISLLMGLLLLLFTGYWQTAAQAQQQTFDKAEDAVQALLAACKDNNEQALLDLFGRDHEDLIITSDEQAARLARLEFYQAAQESLKLEAEGDERQVLIVGSNEWPFPIPLLKEASGWRFDTASGADEILNRRIGRNELEAIAMLQALVDAQFDYASEDRDGDEVLEYAQRIVSSEGNKDGLYWPADEDAGEPLSPLGPYLSDAGDYLEGKSAGDPWYGYYFKVLTQQGEHPPGGAYDYVINGNMIAGFALVAVPAEYGSSGIMTFIVNHQGKIHEQDLGENTTSLIKAMQAYDPDESWSPVKGE